MTFPRPDLRALVVGVAATIFLLCPVSRAQGTPDWILRMNCRSEIEAGLAMLPSSMAKKKQIELDAVFRLHVLDEESKVLRPMKLSVVSATQKKKHEGGTSSSSISKETHLADLEWITADKRWRLHLDEETLPPHITNTLSAAQIRHALNDVAAQIRSSSGAPLPPSISVLRMLNGSPIESSTHWVWEKKEMDVQGRPIWSGTGTSQLMYGGNAIGSAATRRLGVFDPALGWFRSVEAEWDGSYSLRGAKAHLHRFCKIWLDPEERQETAAGEHTEGKKRHHGS